MKFFRKSYWYATTFIQKHWKILVFAVIFGLVLFQILFRVLPIIIPSQRIVYAGRVGNITLSNLPIDIQEKISDGLTKVGENGEILPALAERWSIEDSGKTFRFVMKKDRQWQDGKQVKPEDISYNFSDTDVYTTQNEIVFKLKDVFIPFPSVVTQPIFREGKETVLGTGEYRIRKIKKQGSTIQEFQIESPEERIVYRFYPTEDLLVSGFKKGEVDLIENLSTQYDFVDNKHVLLEKHVQKDSYVALFFNLNDTLFDKDVRLALNYATEKPRGNERVLSPILSTSWAYNKTIKEYAKDYEKAAEFIFRSVPKKPIIIEMTTAVQFQTLAEQIKQGWEEFGIYAKEQCLGNKDIEHKEDCANLEMKIQLKITNFPDLSSFQTLIVGMQIPPDPDQYFLWHSTQNTNFTHYKSPKVDKLLEDGRKIADQAERKLIYQDFQQYLTEDSPAMFIGHVTSYAVRRI